MSKLYYTAPAKKLFEEVRQKAIEIWQTYDDTYGYATGKINCIKEIKNIGDNFMYIVAMFDELNELKLSKSISKEARKAISERLASGGTPDQYNKFNEG